MKRKVLLLGLGFWGKFWLELLNSKENLEIVGVAGAKSELDSLADKNIKTYTDFREAIINTKADIAINVLPGILHLEADKLALQHNMNIITEKPLAMNIEEAEELLEEKKKYPHLKFMASQNYRWRSHNQLIKKIILEGKIGKIQTILLNFRKQEDLQGYRKGLEQPLLQDVSIHHFDLIRFFTGKNLKSIYCQCYKPSYSEFDGKPNTEAIIEMEDNIMVNYSGTWAARGKETSWDGEFIITGDKGALHLDENNDVYFYPFQKNESVKLGTEKENKEKLLKPQMQYEEMEYCLEEMLRCLNEDKIPETTLEDNFESYKMVALGLKSVKTGKKEENK